MPEDGKEKGLGPTRIWGRLWVLKSVGGALGDERRPQRRHEPHPWGPGPWLQLEEPQHFGLHPPVE